MALDSAATVLIIVAVVALAVAGAAAFYASARRNRVFEPVHRTATVVEEPLRPVVPVPPAAETVEEEHYTHTVRRPAPGAAAGPVDPDDPLGRPPR